MNKSDMTKRDCKMLLAVKGLAKDYYIANMNGIDRFIGPDKYATSIRSWDELYAKISALPNLHMPEVVPANAVDPKGMTDEQIAELAK